MVELLSETTNVKKVRTMSGGSSIRSDVDHLTPDEALVLAKKGRVSWNEWAQNNAGAEVDFSTITLKPLKFSDFSGFIFPGYTNFQGTRIEDANFDRAEFRGDVVFGGAVLTGNETHFKSSKFQKTVSFEKTQFASKRTSFFGAKFLGDWSNFQKAVFEGNFVTFSESKFCNGKVNFNNAVFSGKFVKFDKVEFRGSDLTFQFVNISNAVANFKNTYFIDCSADFSNSRFTGGGANYNAVRFSGKKILFLDTVFQKGDANFQNVNFGSDVVDFTRACFEDGATTFKEAEFSNGEANFYGTLFKGNHANFSNTEFISPCHFTGATFECSLTMENSKFNFVPDLRRTKLAAHFTFHDMIVGYQISDQKIWKVFDKAENALDTDKYRRLKEMAIAAKDHDKELDFFAQELKAKRGYEINGGALLISFIYEWFSNFGRSILRPFLWLVGIWFLSGAGFWISSIFHTLSPFKNWMDGFMVSAAVLTPFTAMSRRVFSSGGVLESLFGSEPGLIFYFFSVLEGSLGITFLFLIGLALRNRFRI